MAEGPAIPDELLVARDDGRVVFFCGAGVSRARAGLPGFFGLASNVSDALGVTADSPARRIIQEANDVGERVGIEGLVAADRVFGLLEQEFRKRDIEAAVAKELLPPDDVDLSAHKIMIDLAKSATGEVRLVTTNFDLLFEACDGALNVWQPPQLPDPLRPKELNGIVHLHGRINDTGDGADGEGFVLASSEFGRAYLAEGWASRFIQNILDHYLVVFVGYTANDPPIQYLLEALRQTTELGRAFAFQSGTQSDAQAKWRHKGVEAISYDDSDGHKHLWETLAAWSERARSPDSWYSQTIALAQKGPATLAPHQRGQVAHVVSTIIGARRFASANTPPPAEWLCVFDPFVRYAAPRRSMGHSGSGELTDPFDYYGIDSDPVPKKIDPDDIVPKRDTPPDLWNGLALSRIDTQNLGDSSYAALRGPLAKRVPNLTPRLFQLGIWIGKVSHQPATVWWAAGQVGLHPEIRNQISIHIDRTENDYDPEICQAWRYLFEAWDSGEDLFHRDWYSLKAQVKRDGWSSSTIRKLEVVYRPFFKAERPFGVRPLSAEANTQLCMNQLVRLDVDYPNQQEDPEIPDQWLALAAQVFGRILELGVRLESELGGFGLSNISPIIEDPNLEGNAHQRRRGLSKSLLLFVDLFRRLIEIDPSEAKRELSSWPHNEESVFAKLRVWASRYSRLMSGAEAGEVYSNLSDGTFWSPGHARDLLLSIAERWSDLPVDARSEIETRLLRGRSRWEDEDEDEFDKRQAQATLSRLHWLAIKGCNFSFDLEDQTSQLKKLAPEWTSEYAEHAADSLESTGGSVRRDTECADLLDGPVATVLARAQEAVSQRKGLLVESDPFAGLAHRRPLRAFTSLTLAAKKNEFPTWGWRTFLNSEARDGDRTKFSALIAQRIARMPAKILLVQVRPIADWLLRVTPALLVDFPDTYGALWKRLTCVLSSTRNERNSITSDSREVRDWAEAALNSPVGSLAQALLKDPIRNEFSSDTGFDSQWIERVEDLIGLGGADRKHALVFVAYYMNWFFWIDPDWTEKKVLSILLKNDEESIAIWDGFFWAANVPTTKLYLKIKQELLALAGPSSSDKRREHTEVLAGILLAGWRPESKDAGYQCISNQEMRALLVDANEQLRCQVLWQLQRWSSKEDTEDENGWYELLPSFLENVWPRQMAVNSPQVSEQLVELAFAQRNRFPRICDVVLPLVTKIDRDHIILPHVGGHDGKMLDEHPSHVLALLHAILPSDVRSWPYGIEEALNRIILADPSLREDDRLVELKRQWDDR